MNNSIPYLVKKGDTLQSIANELGIDNPLDLRHYHNMNAGIKDGIGSEPSVGKTLLTPPQDEIVTINKKNEERQKVVKADSEKEEEKKQQEQEKEQQKQQQEQEKQKEVEKNAHDNKFFVVHGGLCCCNKAENPKQTAKLLVTSHNKVIYNGEEGKFTATEVDKTFDPAAATFGKCTLKPSSGGNQPCALASAPKWTKVYDKTSIFGNKVLTEISTLQCTVGGKIEVVKSGQTDMIMKEHAENTNLAALALINPAVKMPVLETAYPSVSNITLKSLKNIPDFKPVSSSDTKNVERVTIRQNEECTFLAKIKKGNVNLTSWVIYDGFTGDKDKRLFTEEQLGTSFKYTFSTLGKYRIEGYGKPKKEDFEGGKHNKNYPDCSIDVEVAVNTLDGTELVPIDGENFAKIISGKMRLRQNFPATFKSKFLMPPTDSELENLKMYVTDALGNVLKSTKIENTVSFTPENTKAKYIVTAVYKLDTGEESRQNFTGETITNTVSEITHDAAVIRPGTPMTFAVKASTFSLYIPDEQEAIAKEVRAVKWNLNGRLLGTGRNITIPGYEFMKLGNYVVEAYVTLANAYGQNAKHENDDWHFEVKENDVVSFSYNGVPKVGKTTLLEADQLVFPKLMANEVVVWDTVIPHTIASQNTIAIKPLKAGKEIVKCLINRQPGKTLSIDVKQAKVLGMMFTDSNGIEIEKSSWYQTVNIWVKQEHLIGEDLAIEIWDNDAFKDDYCKVINVKKYEGNLIPFTLDSYVKGKAGDWGMLYVKIGAPQLKLANENNVFKSKNHLNVEDKREIYSAQIGTQDGKERHYHVDYNKISYFYGKSRGIKAGEKLKLTIYEKGKMLFEVKDVIVDTSGAIQAKLQWDNISQKLPMRTVYAVVQDSEDKILYNGTKTTNGGVVVTKKSALLGLAEYKSAVLVQKSKNLNSKKENKNIACECEARVRAFMRMLRVGESTVGEKGYTTAFNHNKITDLSTHPMKNYGGSTAAGAYQIMRYTYAWLGGSKLRWNGEYYEILDIYEKEHDYRKKYNIQDFQPESQDKLCICLMKDKKGMIDLIIAGNIEKAIRDYGSLIWASLPHIGDSSYYYYKNKPQPATPMKKCLNNFDIFFKEEMQGKSDLHLKKGFLKEFIGNCCSNADTENNNNCSCGKAHYNNAKPVHWIHQDPSKCWDASVKILDNYGIKGGSRRDCIIMSSQSGKILTSVNAQLGIDYIDSQLKKGNPVVVGLDDNLRETTYNVHKATDHFFVIVGCGCEDGKRFYNFFDVGSKTREQGTSSSNKLIIHDDLLISGKSNGGTHKYTITEVRRNN